MALDESLHNAPGDSPEVWAPIHAIRLLGELRAADAVRPLMPLLRRDDDYISQALPEAYGLIGEPALAPMAELLSDTLEDVWTRVRAAAALSEIAQAHPSLREQAIATLTVAVQSVTATHRADPRMAPFSKVLDETTLNGFIISNLVDLGATQAVDAIRTAFEHNHVDLSVVDFDDALEALGQVRASDIVRPGEPIPATIPAERIEASIGAVVPRPLRRIGRNDPCPCGSGKKYKRCCGR
jgi:uncharacterized protein YecA (UPF0149 family)